MNHKERAHAPLSPSSFKRLMQCPGSYYLTKDMPDAPTSKYAEEGTYVHELIENIWTMWQQGSDSILKVAGIYLNSIGEDDPEIIECISGYFEFCFDLEKKFKALCDGEEVTQTRRFIEKRIELSKNIWGTLDYALAGMRNGKLEILCVDFKFGAGVKVKAQDNPQLVIYGLGINKELGGKANKIRCYIYQPRAGGEKPYSSFVLEKEEITEWGNRIMCAQENSLSVTEQNVIKMLSAGSHCRFCKALAVCPERNKTALSLIEPIKEANSLPLIPTEKLVQIFKAKKQVEHLLDAVEAHLHQLAESGMEIPGLKLVQTKGKRSWAFKGRELDDKLQRIAIEDGVDVLKIYKPRAVINLTDAEKLLGKEAISDLVSLPAVRNQLVSVEDERLEVEIVNLIDEIKNE